MKSDEFSGKMLDDHIEVFCYCNFDYYRNLFWCFCISIYEKEKGSFSGQYCLYWNYVCAVSEMCIRDRAYTVNVSISSEFADLPASVANTVWLSQAKTPL